MGILDRFRRSPTASDPGSDAAEDPRVSPQGWTDEVPGWPPGMAPTPADRFPRPEDAVTQIVQGLEALQLSAGEPFDAAATSQRLDQLHAALLALRLPAAEMSRRKASYGRLLLALSRYLPAVPWVAGKRVLRECFRTLAEDLASCEDAALAGEARPLAEALQAAVSAVAYLTHPELAPLPAGPERSTGPSAPPPPAGLGADAAAPTTRPTPPSLQDAAAIEGDASAATPTSPSAASPPLASAPAAGTADPQEEGPDLTREKIYRCLLEECLKDGTLDSQEEEAILSLRRQLGIPVHRHAAMVREVTNARRDGQLSGEDEMDPLTFFEKIYVIAWQDGVVTDDEANLLRSVARHLGLDRAEVAAVEEKVRPADA